MSSTPLRSIVALLIALVAGGVAATGFPSPSSAADRFEVTSVRSGGGEFGGFNYYLIWGSGLAIDIKDPTAKPGKTKYKASVVGMKRCVSYPRTAYGKKATLSLSKSDVCPFEAGKKYRITVRKIEGKKTVATDRAAGVWRYVAHPDGMRWDAEGSTEDTVKAGSEVTLSYDGDWSTRRTKVAAGVSWSSTDQGFPDDDEEYCADEWHDCGMTPAWDEQTQTFTFTVPEELVGKYLWISSYGSAEKYNPWGFWFDPVQVVE